jgi:hypothetical protein
MKDIKKQFNKDIEILKRIKQKSKSSICEIKKEISMESLTNTLDQVEKRTSGLEDKVDKLEYQTVKRK